MPNLRMSVPAIKGFYGKRIETFQTQVLPEDMQGLLGHDPRPENWKFLPSETRNLYEHLQRKTTKDRRRSVRDYVVDRMSDDAITIGAFPSICVGMTEPPDFVSFGQGRHEDIGDIKLPVVLQTPRVLLDGLARLTGTCDLIRENDEAKEWFTFPVTIFAPSREQKKLTMRQLGQLFHDFNVLNQTVAAAHAMALDQSAPFILVANALGQSDIVQRFGGMERRAQKLGTKSTALTTQYLLVRFVYCATQGKLITKKLLMAPGRIEKSELVEKVETCREFLNTLAEKMGDARFSDRTSIHLSSQGLQALGLALHDINKVVKKQDSLSLYEQIIEAIAKINWSRTNPDWVGLIGELKDPTDPTSIKLGKGGNPSIIALRKYIHEHTELGAMLSELEAANLSQGMEVYRKRQRPSSLSESSSPAAP